MKEVVAAIVPSGPSSYLLQLRDFHDWIDYPGCWGLFAGQLEPGEQLGAAMRRELREELGSEPVLTNFYRTFHFDASSMVVHAFACSLASRIEDLKLAEGQEVGDISTDDIRAGSAMSSLWNRRFPLVPEASHILNCYTRS